MMKKLWPVLCLPLILAGCAKSLDVATITEIIPTNGNAGLDVYAKQRMSGQDVPQMSGDQIVEVRSYRATEDGYQGKEFAGANCRLTASGYSANMRTPAKVRVPLYRSRSSMLAVACQHPEYAPKTMQSGAYNKTKSDRMSMGANAGVIGVLAVAVVNQASDDTTHDFHYPPLKVVMTPLKQSRTR